MGVRVDTREWKEFSEKLRKLSQEQATVFMTSAVKECANQLLSIVVPRTPARRIPGGGTLRRGWLNNTALQAARGSGTNFSGGDFSARAGALNVERGKRGGYSITITNPVYYASYVEYGHRQKPGRYVPAIGKRLVADWVEGQHFLKISEEQLKTIAPELLEKMLNDFLRTVF